MHETGLDTERDCIMLPWKPWMDEWNVLRGSLRSYVARQERDSIEEEMKVIHVQCWSNSLERFFVITFHTPLRVETYGLRRSPPFTCSV